MSEALREWLYPLGALPAIAFGLRFLLQWALSERAKQSVVVPLFWQISLIGNVLLLVHSIVQVQFHVGIIQACNGVISWRNLNLMQPKDRLWQLSSVVMLLALTIAAVFIIFAAQAYIYPYEASTWFRSPTTSWNAGYSTSNLAPFLWHTIGTSGLLLFNCRFWIQWWNAERCGTSVLTPIFWWISLLGALLCIFYFYHIGDTVNLIGPVVGIIPYIRNLMIISSNEKGQRQKCQNT